MSKGAPAPRPRYALCVDAEALRPCPFCANDEPVLGAIGKNAVERIAVICPECGAVGPCIGRPGMASQPGRPHASGYGTEAVETSIESAVMPPSVTIALPGPAATSTIVPFAKVAAVQLEEPAKRVATVDPEPTTKVPAGEALTGIGPAGSLTGACQAPFTGR